MGVILQRLDLPLTDVARRHRQPQIVCEALCRLLRQLASSKGISGPTGEFVHSRHSRPLRVLAKIVCQIFGRLRIARVGDVLKISGDVAELLLSDSIGSRNLPVRLSTANQDEYRSTNEA